MTNQHTDEMREDFSSYEVEFFGDDVTYVKADTHERLLKAYEALQATTRYQDALREVMDMAMAALPYTPDHIPRSAFNSIISTITALLGDK